MISIDGVMPITESQYHNLTNYGSLYLINKAISNCVIYECILLCDSTPTANISGSVKYEKHNFRIEFSATIGE